MGLFNTEADVSSPYEMAGKVLAAQRAYAPRVLELNREYQPQYTQFTLESIQDLLQGVGGAPGMLEILGQMPGQYAQHFAAGATEAAPAINQSYETSDPITAKLLATLGDQAQRDLDAGGKLSPGVRREVQQTVRGGQAARGMGYGPTDMYEEAMSVGSAAEARKAQAQNLASVIAQLRESILGRYRDNMLYQGANAVSPYVGAQFESGLNANVRFDPFGGGGAQYVMQGEGLKADARQLDRKFLNDTRKEIQSEIKEGIKAYFTQGQSMMGQGFSGWGGGGGG